MAVISRDGGMEIHFRKEGVRPKKAIASRFWNDKCDVHISREHKLHGRVAGRDRQCIPQRKDKISTWSF